MRADSFYIPKKNPSKPLGEDAHFISHESQVIGVADGVGGWASKGIDAGEYARELMRNAADIVRDRRPSDVDPKQVLEDSFSKTESPGSSTACVLSLAGNLLRAANLGDSGFLVIRGGNVVYGSPAQQHSFNFPYQMGKSSGGVEAAEEMAVAVKAGDVVVVGTDGLFDNVFPEDIESTVEFCLENKYEPDITAWVLGNTACRNSMDVGATCPFEVAAHEAGVEHFGGKYDDITVVVAYVVKLY
ncbi:probable protein phosphatase 2c 55 [Phtheirospermum japonicum]|uniref:Protein phosphatase n=1 Tax=Phtheirospermum japonicum TaxID=374723 RepID=A0A830BWZ4_9LAMI|nr:probable protein phosphatase 2c 55 [Phtheirospermum japonicum]